jgi:hypothetical protein
MPLSKSDILLILELLELWWRHMEYFVATIIPSQIKITDQFSDSYAEIMRQLSPRLKRNIIVDNLPERNPPRNSLIARITIENRTREYVREQAPYPID